MLRFIGDIHSAYYTLPHYLETLNPEDTVIQLGDFGIWPGVVNSDNFKRVTSQLTHKVHFIEGNHEYFPLLPIKATEPIELYDNLIYVPRCVILEVEGHNVLCVGGACSVDRKYRTPGLDWFPEERVSGIEVKQAEDLLGTRIDMMATHNPPYDVVAAIFGKDQPVEWNHSAKAIQEIWDMFDNPPIFSGHLHMTKRMGKATVVNMDTYFDVAF